MKYLSGTHVATQQKIVKGILLRQGFKERLVIFNMPVDYSQKQPPGHF